MEQASVCAVFLLKTITLKDEIMFQRMEIAENIYEDVVEPSYIKN